ncbi:MAG TPA: hypothetical protein PKV92_05095 [Thermodesulfovibrio thiophilus]|nr:hypothetical protein [Thermodesulfovibrio thiophilus]
MPKAVIYGKDGDKIQKILTALKSQGFNCLTVLSYDEAVLLLEMEDDIIFVINEGNDSNKLIQNITSLPMYKRRNIFLVIVGDNVPTMSRLFAFKEGLNLTVNTKDIENFSAYFKKTYLEYKNFYKNFKELAIKY